MRFDRSALFGVLLLVPRLTHADDGYVGIFSDPQGTTPCATVAQGTGTTLYVVGVLAGASVNGITGAEFRIEVSNSAGWFLSYAAPTGAAAIGSALDLDPADPDDGTGLNISFSSCQVGTNGKALLGTVGVFNLSGTATTLAVKRHSSPRNAGFPCALFTLCDDPSFSKVCMSQSEAPSCAVGKPRGQVAGTDLPVFVAGLNVLPDEEPGGGLDSVLSIGNPLVRRPALVSDPEEQDAVGATGGGIMKIASDTLWKADWSFEDANGVCNASGWAAADHLVLNDGSSYWYVGDPSTFLGAHPPVLGNAAILRNTNCYTGYGNSWDFAIRLKYRGYLGQLSFDYLLSSEAGHDFMSVEMDSAGASDVLVTYQSQDGRLPSQHRVLIGADSGGDGTVRHFGPVTLDAFSNPNVDHTVLIRFSSDYEKSDEDGLFNSPISAGLIVDNIVVTGVLAYSEDFQGTLNTNVALVNSARSKPFCQELGACASFPNGWARLYSHVTDNDKCAENASCAWLFSDPVRTAYFPSMAFGPAQAVTRPWMDNVIVSPWVSLSPNSDPRGAILSYRVFGGNAWDFGRMGMAFALRGRIGSCVTDWNGDEQPDTRSTWEDLDRFTWATDLWDISQAVNPTWDAVQVRFRVADWQGLFHAHPPATLNPGPGPFIDRVRIGRVPAGPLVYVGPDLRFQAQDAFPTELAAGIVPGEHFRPTSDIFGTCAFSMAQDIGIPDDPTLPPATNLITGDSIVAAGYDLSSNNRITKAAFYFQVVAGPHLGKPAPSPGNVVQSAGQGWYKIEDDYGLGRPGPIRVHVDFDDTYFRGGDILRYFWFIETGSGGGASYPPGITAIPLTGVTLAQAEAQTGGLLEVNFLPTIVWDPGYLTRISNDPVGDLDPTPAEKSNSYQATCLLYMNGVNTARRSGTANRTSFMFTLDRLGYQNHYDTYDLQGAGNVNNELGGRAGQTEVSRYGLIVHDVGRARSTALADGSDLYTSKIDQAQFYRDFLGQGVTSPAGSHSVWLIGENLAFMRKVNPLITTDCALASVVDDQGIAVSPAVHGSSSFTFAGGGVQHFSGDNFALAGGCPTLRNYDGFTSAGTAVVTHNYAAGTTTGTGAVVMNKNAVLRWNTVAMGFNWFDIVDGSNGSPTGPRTTLASKVLQGVLPVECVSSGSTTDVPNGDTSVAVPRAHCLYPAAPNPANPTTTVRFDVASDVRVRVRLFDVAGHRIRSLVDGPLPAGQHTVAWNGLDDAGARVAGGLYLVRYEAGEFVAVEKVVLVK